MQTDGFIRSWAAALLAQNEKYLYVRAELRVGTVRAKNMNFIAIHQHTETALRMSEIHLASSEMIMK